MKKTFLIWFILLASLFGQTEDFTGVFYWSDGTPILPPAQVYLREFGTTTDYSLTAALNQPGVWTRNGMDWGKFWIPYVDKGDGAGKTQINTYKVKTGEPLITDMIAQWDMNTWKLEYSAYKDGSVRYNALGADVKDTLVNMKASLQTQITSNYNLTSANDIDIYGLQSDVAGVETDISNIKTARVIYAGAFDDSSFLVYNNSFTDTRTKIFTLRATGINTAVEGNIVVAPFYKQDSDSLIRLRFRGYAYWGTPDSHYVQLQFYPSSYEIPASSKILVPFRNGYDENSSSGTTYDISLLQNNVLYYVILRAKLRETTAGYSEIKLKDIVIQIEN